jgi:hypothetical protein
MARKIDIVGLNIIANLQNCAHSCRYCSIGRRPVQNLSALRFAKVVERFFDWQETNDKKSFKLGRLLGYNANHDQPTFEILQRLDDRGANLNWPRLPRRFLSGFTLGGLPWRSDNELQTWLLMLRDEFGLKGLVATLSGAGAVHDRWNGKSGNFDLLMSTLRIGGRLGLGLSARLLITRSTLPCLDELHESLSSLPGGCTPSYAPFYYSGFAARFEDERITEDIRDSFLAKLYVDVGCKIEKWFSEREFIEQILIQEEQRGSIFLNLVLTDETIDYIESTSCDEIVTDLEQRTRAAYAALPTLHELCETYGDRTNRLVYGQESCVDRKWIDLFLHDNALAFERHLTHFGSTG